ncbi:hypothetical protein BE20_11360 [Sorangium cellulosum]|nr:hypothetical protein BE20_11360 [Sorangium cellulosum]
MARVLPFPALLRRDRIVRGADIRDEERRVRGVGGMERRISDELTRMYPDQVKPKRSMEQDVYRFDRHIYPIAGRTPVAAFALDDAERVMRCRT